MLKKRTLIIIITVLALMAVAVPVAAQGNGWFFTAVPQKTCFPASPAFVKVDVTVNAPDRFFPLLVTFDPPLPSGVLPNIESIEITERGTTVVGWLLYFDGFGTTTKDYTFTLTSLGRPIGKPMAETVTITWGTCPVIGEPPDSLK